ncbi:MAG: response regulator [Phycisphaera sp.]|nr:response regulator [Phycisphaera sp.]
MNLIPTPGSQAPSPAPGSHPGSYPGSHPGSLAQESAGASPSPANLDNLDLSESTILVVDDNAQNLELLQAYLETLSCKTLSATDGIEAMKIIEQAVTAGTGLPDLVLLDVMMPRMSGFEVCRKIKEDPATRSIPVMMVTALNELGDIERGVESGTDDFLTKPVNKLELLTRVKSLLRVRHLKRELDRTMAYIQDIESRRGEGDSGEGPIL